MSKSDKEFWARERQLLESDLPSAEIKWVTQKTIAILKAFQADVESNGAKFIVINIDDKKDLDGILSQVPNLTYYNYQSKLAALATKQPLTFKYDPHYQPATHKEIGKW